MVAKAIAHGSFLKIVTKGLITLTHKGGHRKTLGKWLSIIYKIYAKALQLWPQEHLERAPSSIKNSFLNNIMLTYETLARTKKTI